MQSIFKCSQLTKRSLSSRQFQSYEGCLFHLVQGMLPLLGVSHCLLQVLSPFFLSPLGFLKPSHTSFIASAQWPPVAPGHHTEQHRSKTFTSKGSIRQCCSKSLFCLQVNTYGRRPQPMVCASYCIVQKKDLTLIGHSWLQGTNYVQIVKLSQIMKCKSKCTKYIHMRQNQ